MKRGLSTHEKDRARATSVHVVWYVYVEEDAVQEDVTWGIPVAIHATKDAAIAEAASRRGPPAPGKNPSGRYLCDEPCNLLAFVDTLCDEDADVVRTVLRGQIACLPPKVWYSPGYYRQYLSSPPLLADEQRRACALMVWTVYYQDHFHFGQSRESHPVAICLTEAEAEADVERRGRLTPGFDGHVVSGPYPLSMDSRTTSGVGADVIREVLRRVAEGEPGPIVVM